MWIRAAAIALAAFSAVWRAERRGWNGDRPVIGRSRLRPWQDKAG
jgi:hypothetical protein